ncbi:DUF4126 family protein [Pedobacter alpinus]|uniref:DUF4126 family protein n=1 Tax=Pedobacter alpinus TaxID=1590643 RepID=A0ABW5TY54_9SPHI
MKNPFLKTVILGLSAGMRSMAPLSLITTKFNKNKQLGLQNSKLNFMQSGITSNLLDIAALGELAGDKDPNASNRTETLSVLGRCASGALVGATVYKAAFKNPLHGAMLGATAALASTFIFFHLRKKITRKTGKNNLVAMTEDVLAFSAASVVK